jgi:tRNA A37 threonylcarbamoyladenosine dehydratase
MTSTIGQPKAEIVGQRLLDINPELDLTILSEYLRDQRVIDVLDQKFDYVVDAIDTLAPKVYLIYHSLQKNIPIVSSMGSGGKTDPTKVSIADIAKTHHCQLARMVRKRLHKLGVKKGVKAVYSPEEVRKEAIRLEESTNKASNVGTISYMPNVFGCFCASVVIRDLTSFFHPVVNSW